MFENRKLVITGSMRCWGYSRLEVMLVAIVTGVLTSLLYPIYEDVQVRNKVRTVMGESTVVTEAISEHYFSNAALPDSNASAGLKAAGEYQSELIKSIDVGDGGAVTIALNDFTEATSDPAEPTEDYASITLKPKTSIMGQLIWTCSSSTIDDKYTPVPCNGDTATVPNFIPQTAWQLTK